MKKLRNIILCLVAVFMLYIPNVLAKGKPVYVFSKEGCPNCENLENYFNSVLKEDKDLFDFFIIEVVDAHGNFESEESKNLIKAVLEHFDQSTEEIYFPSVIIGDYFHLGFNPNAQEDLLNKVKEYLDDENSKDIVKEKAKELNINLDDLRRVSEEEKAKEEGKYDAIILIGIFVVLIGGFAGFIILGRK